MKNVRRVLAGLVLAGLSVGAVAVVSGDDGGSAVVGGGTHGSRTVSDTSANCPSRSLQRNARASPGIHASDTTT